MISRKSFISLIILTVTWCSLQAQTVSPQVQTVSIQSIKSNKFQFPVSNKKFTLTITGVKATDNITVYLDQNAAIKIPATTKANGRLNFILDEELKDETNDSLKFFVFDEKKQKDIGFFMLAMSAGSNGLLGAGGEKQDFDPVAFYDAQILYPLIMKENFAACRTIIEKYDTLAVTDADIEQIIKGNPFFQKFLQLNKGKKNIAFADSAKAANANALSAVIAGLGGIDVTKYVQATADFLRDRVKEELAIAFIEKFKAALDNIPELKAMLPKTYTLFSTSDLFKAPSMGQTYKTAFQEDLASFITNFELFVDTTTNQRYVALRTSQAITAFRLAYHAIDLSANDTHPVYIFEFLDARFGLDVSAGRNREINHYTSLLYLLSQNLRSKEAAADGTKAGWISVDEFKKFNPKAMLLFWGLLYQQNPGVFNGVAISGKSLTQILLNGSSTVQVYLKEFVVLAHTIDQRIAEFNTIIQETSTDAKAAVITAFVANADKILEITDFIFRLPYFKNELGGQSFYQSDYYNRWRPVIVDVIETTKGVYAKDFAKISVNAASLIGHLSQLHRDTVFTKHFLEDFTYYTNFLVDAINADSANDVKEVLNRYAEPVRSYRVKRRTQRSVSLNAYPGLYFGWERTQDEPKQTSKTFGVTAPIGLSFNWGNKKGWSKSIFLNAVDIGAALSFRWNNDTLDLPQKITLEQIFAPGAFFVLGFPNIPISAKAGFQYVPQLRSISKAGNTVDEVPVVRYGLSVVVDVPVFNFRNRRLQVYKN